MVALGARSGAPPFFVSAFLPRLRLIDTTPWIWIRRPVVSIDRPAMATTGRRTGTTGWIPVRRAVVSPGKPSYRSAVWLWLRRVAVSLRRAADRYDGAS